MFHEPQHQSGLGSAHRKPCPPRAVNEGRFGHRGELRFCRGRRSCCCWCRRRRSCCRCCCSGSIRSSSSARRAPRRPRGRSGVNCLPLRRRLARGGLRSSTLRSGRRRLLLLLLLLLLSLLLLFRHCFRRRCCRRGLGLLLRLLVPRVALLLHQQRADEYIGRVGRDDLALCK